MLIRPYRDADEPAVVRLWRETLFDPAPHNDPATAIRMKREVADGLFFVAEVEGEVAGTVMGGYDGHRGWVYSVAVSPAHRRRGIGGALVRHLVGELAGRGCLKVNLQVRSSNAVVVAFYESLGFKVEPIISMGKRLDEAEGAG